MASKISTPVVFRHILKRNFAAEAAPKYIENTVSSKTSVTPTKILVASSAPDSPIAEVSISFKAGARYEHGESLGINHVLRSAFGLASEEVSNFGLTRHIQQLGLNLYATTDREVISYTLQGNKDKIEEGFKFLLSAATKQAFNPWEIADNNDRLRYDLLTIPPQARALDLAHKAAFQYGLGNSLYADPNAIGHFDSETLQHYVQNNFTANRASVTGVGVSHDALVEIANALPITSGPPPSAPKSTFFSAEEKYYTPSNTVFAAIVSEGIGLNSKEAYAFAALKYAIGAGPQIKYGTGVSPFSKAVQSFKHPVGISAFNISYSDAGLFGVAFVTPGQQAAEVAKAAVKVLKSGNVSADDAKRGINQLAAAVLLESEPKTAVSEDLRSQVTALGAVQDLGSVVKAITALSPTDVQNAAKKVGSGKLALGAVGNVGSLPHISTLG